MVELDEIVLKENGRIVFRNGRQTGIIKQEYGHRILQLFYKDVLVAEIGNFNTNNWYSNDYKIELSETRDGLKISYSINGPSGKRDSFQKRYLRNKLGQLIRVEYSNESEIIYNTEAFN